MPGKSLRVNLYTDGGARGNPGPAGAGIVLLDADDGQVLQEAGFFLGRATNNVAEYTALVRGLEVAEQLGAVEVAVHSDSELLVKQMKGEYRVKNQNLAVLHAEARKLADRFDRVRYEHVRREKNARADLLANKAMNRKGSVQDADD